MYIPIHACICKYTCTICMCIYTCTHMHVYIHMHIHTCIYTYTYIPHLYTYIHMHFYTCVYIYGLPRWHSDKVSACQCRGHKRHQFFSWAGKIPWRRKWQPTPVFLPGESHELSLCVYGLWTTVHRVAKRQTRLSH